MAENQSDLKDLVDALTQTKDELKVQIHLAGLEARDEYQRVSEKLDDLRKQYQPVSEALNESAGAVIAALTLAAEEMKCSFSRIANSLKDSTESDS